MGSFHLLAGVLLGEGDFVIKAVLSHHARSGDVCHVESENRQGIKKTTGDIIEETFDCAVY